MWSSMLVQQLPQHYHSTVRPKSIVSGFTLSMPPPLLHQAGRPYVGLEAQRARASGKWLSGTTLRHVLQRSVRHYIGRYGASCPPAWSNADLREPLGPRHHRVVVAEAAGTVDVPYTAQDSSVQNGGRFVLCRGRAAKRPVVLNETRYDDVGMVVRAERMPDGTHSVFLQLSDPRPFILHWATDDWATPDSVLWPPGTQPAGGGAVQSAFGGRGELRIDIPKDLVPTRLVFVLKQPAGGGNQEAWYNNGGANYIVQLRAPPLESFVEKVLTAEGTYTHWSLPQRLALAAEVVDAAEAAGPPGMSFLFTWLRLSSTRVLDWYRGANFQPKDIASMQKHAGERMADKARSAGDPLVRLLARGALAGLPRGGGNGDDIRMGILHIMRGNGIREGHRPGHDEPFLEQWHQKLHTNTSPDDVIICEAYLAYLHSGNHDDYWRVLWERGNLTREKMEGWTKPIRAWPQHLPHLIPAFQGYLWTLKTTHSGADLDTAMEMAKGFMDDELRWILYDILSHRHEWWVPGKIVEARERLAHYWKAPGSSRDLLLLDIALEGWFRTCIERTDPRSMSGDDLVQLLGLMLRGAMITHGELEEVSAVSALWDRLRNHGSLPGERWGREWALAGVAVAERLGLGLAAHMDRLYGLVQPHAEAFASACRLPAAHTANFGEEVVRGQALFAAAPLLAELEQKLRAAAGGAGWQVVSSGPPAPPTGQLLAVPSLASVQGASYSSPTLLLAGSLTGVEDIPPGVVAVLTRSSTDVLSHLAIRARSQRVLLASCYDETAWAEWQDLAVQQQASDQAITALVDTALGSVTPKAAPHGSTSTTPSQATTAAAAAPRLNLVVPERTDAWALREESFRQGLVGAKALNLATLRRRLAEVAAGGEEIAVPASVALPYGTFERVLADPANANVAAEVTRLAAAAAAVAAASGGGGEGSSLPRLELEELRRVVTEDLHAPPELVRQLAEVAAAQGLITSPETWITEAATAATHLDGDNDVTAEEGVSDEDWEGEEVGVTSSLPSSSSRGAGWSAVWRAVCGVWASKWTDRAWLSRRAVGLEEGELVMSVLLQQIIPFDYAFVLHTSNPVTHKQGELLGEVVCGLGEALVGNYPGRALGFTHEGGQEPQLLSLPSKRLALRCPPATSSPLLIARSDANAEDLEQYAAAGLYDSIPLIPLTPALTHYAAEPLLGDPGVRYHLMRQLAAAGRAVAGALGGGDQDVEGGMAGGRLYVVQARPQVQLH